jgi:hypothetical protein
VDRIGGETAQFGVPADDLLVLRQVDAEGLAPGDEGFNPLDIRTEGAERLVGRFRRLRQGCLVGLADVRNVAFDHELAHGRLRPASGPAG